MNVLMIGVDESTKGGMWTVVENYLKDVSFVKRNNLVYIPTSITGCSIPKRILFTVKSYIRIIKAFKQTRFSILHVHMSERASIRRKGIAMKYARRHGAKVVLHMHGAEFEILYKAMSESRQKFVRKILNMADKVIILGEYWKQFISGLVDNPDKVCVVYNAVKIPSLYNYCENSNRILFLGEVSKRKGIDILLAALKEKMSILSDTYCVDLYGRDAEGDIVEKIEKNGLSKWVKYCGWLDKEKKAYILATTSINVLPSYNEGLPMTILEAMSYGVPSISTSIAAIPEVINETNGILIEPGNSEALANALECLALNKEKRIQLSKQAYEDSKNMFSIEKHIRQIEKIYEELVI